MTLRPTVVWVLLAALALMPVLGLAVSGLSAAPSGEHHRPNLQHQAERVWRTVPTALGTSTFAPAVAPAGRLPVVDAVLALPLVIRIPFVPPRG
jgi:hypothetical protein